MNVAVLDRQAGSGPQAYAGYVDCDVHPYPKSQDELAEFLSASWREHRKRIGHRARQALAYTANYPRMSPATGMRLDAWPPGGGVPGSDLDFMRAQLLNAFDAAYGVMLPLVGRC